jgi:septum formation protein
LQPQLYLASQSPRRQELLRQIGVAFEVIAADVPEHPADHESPREYVTRVAAEKADAALARLRTTARPPLPVLAADTSVVADEHILGKPRDRADAERMLGMLANRTHEVLTAVHVRHEGRPHTAVNTSRVTFGPLSKLEIDRYWDTGEPEDKAGGYAIQGRGAAFVARLEGSYSGVMGLPLYEVTRILNGIGIPLP